MSSRRPLSRPILDPRCILLAIVAFASFDARPARAQSEITEGELIRFVHGVVIQRVRGDVTVTDSVTRHVVGTFLGVRNDSLVVRSHGRQVAASMLEVSAIQVERGRRQTSIAEGAGIGAMIGAGVSLGAAYGIAGNAIIPWGIGWGVMGALVGAPVGAIVNLLRRGPIWEAGTLRGTDES